MKTTVEIVYMPRSRWPKSVQEAFKMRSYSVSGDSLELLEERDTLRRENEALRRQVDACRRLDAEAWALVKAVSRPLTSTELADYPLMWGSESDFIQIIKDRMGAAPKIGKNCPYCGSTFPVELTGSLATVPTPILLSEVGRRNNAARKTNAGGRPKVLKPCPKCGALLGARERARHHC